MLVGEGQTPESKADMKVVPVMDKPKQLKIVPETLQWKLK